MMKMCSLEAVLVVTEQNFLNIDVNQKCSFLRKKLTHYRCVLVVIGLVVNGTQCRLIWSFVWRYDECFSNGIFVLSADAGCDGRCLADIAYCAQNTNGGYSCHCLPGYAGDGETTCTGSYSPHASIVFKLVRGHLH